MTMKNASRSTAAKKPDGRLLRSERSRQAIIDGLLALITEGVLAPTAQQIAERAEVGIRTVFRHFADMESLFATTDSQIRPAYEGLFIGSDRSGTLLERIEHALEQRATVYEKLSPLMLSSKAMIWRSPVIQKNYARSQRGLRKDLLEWLPEINDLSPPRQEAVDSLVSFENWDRLRSQQGLSKKASMEVVNEMLRLVFAIK